MLSLLPRGFENVMEMERRGRWVGIDDGIVGVFLPRYSRYSRCVYPEVEVRKVEMDEWVRGSWLLPPSPTGRVSLKSTIYLFFLFFFPLLCGKTPRNAKIVCLGVPSLGRRPGYFDVSSRGGFRSEPSLEPPFTLPCRTKGCRHSTCSSHMSSSCMALGGSVTATTQTMGGGEPGVQY